MFVAQHSSPLSEWERRLLLSNNNVGGEEDEAAEAAEPVEISDYLNLENWPSPSRKIRFCADADDDGVDTSINPVENLPQPVENFSPTVVENLPQEDPVSRCSRQFWKAGDFEGDPEVNCSPSEIDYGMNHARVHPKFLHSNATSHKWALGALAELLDNSLDEACNGATFVRIDVLEHKKNRSKMLLVEDDGGGMDPAVARRCVSLGYSLKSKQANTIGQYGNGFKTSTMRLGADVIVFTRSPGKGGQRPTQTIGFLSYTFLRETGKEDIMVPMLDYELRGGDWCKIVRTPLVENNVETIVKWSPYSSEEDLLAQFESMGSQGTRVIIYNLWDDDQLEPELDFDTDEYDIQLRGVNRDEKKIEMANKYHNSRHFLTYQHSLRSYAAILYLRLPPGFRMILRGKDIDHHNIEDDMMLIKEEPYKPHVADASPVNIKMGFVKDAIDHIDVQGFNIYHKNRLIKPFWRVWSPAGSDGRGVIGVVEADFVKPAHDKQGFEHTSVLRNLEKKLMVAQKTYWNVNCQQIGYVARNKTVAKGPSKSADNTADSRQGSGVRSRSGSAYKRSPESVVSTSATDLIDFDGVATPVSEIPSGHATSFMNPDLENVDIQDSQLRVDIGFKESKRPSSSKSTGPSKPDAQLTEKRPRREKSRFLQDIIARDAASSPHPSRSEEENRQLMEKLRKMELELKYEREKASSLEAEVLYEREKSSSLKAQVQYEREKSSSLEAQLEQANKAIKKRHDDQSTMAKVFCEERDWLLKQVEGMQGK